MDQNQNWSGTASAPAADNPDKRIRTNFWTAGAQYSFNRSWTAELDVPYWERLFANAAGRAARSAATRHGALGDVRLKGIYTGFSPDLSTGLTFGVKLPTGDSTYPYFDADTQIGTGSTDLLLGAYHRDRLSADLRWSWFTSALGQARRAQVRLPAGRGSGRRARHFLRRLALRGSLHLAPLLQLVGAYRAHDGGPQGDPQNSGYTRVLLAPGLELDAGRTRVYADVSRALYTNVSGNQLVARTLFKVSVSVQF